MAHYEMKMNNAFLSSRPPPFSSQHDVLLKDELVAGPSSLFNPTRARFEYTPKASDLNGSASELSGHPRADVSNGAQFQWRSRDNRKGN